MDEPRAITGNNGRKGPYYYTIRYGLLGAAAGLILPFIATVVVIWGAGLPLNLRSMIFVQRIEPLLWIIDAVPILLGLLGTLAGWREDQHRQSEERYQTLVAALERRVDDRTRELERAVKVGHSVALVDDLETMLAQAVELIRSSFHLYYVQAYLLDEFGRDLIPRAGTGAAGSALATRSQRVLMGLDSIVGTAAVEKQTIVVAKTSDDPMYQPNPLLPDTWSQVATPLILGNRVLGVLDLRSDRPNILTRESLPALEAVAGQLAVAIEHVRLVDETTTTRGDVEDEARFLAHSGWQDFLNAIDRSESLGYSYDEEGIVPVYQPLEPDERQSTLSVPIVVSGQPVGTIQVQGDDGQRWSAADAELATAVSRQVGQQIESLRLLVEAEHYRSEAEEATRRLTREGWDAYLQSRAKDIQGFAYDLSRVQPLTAEPDGDSEGMVLAQALNVRGETIGHLEVIQGSDPDEETAELIAAVAAQLSIHLENLRLTEQTELALAETEEQARRLASLNELGQALASAAAVEDVFTITAQRMGEIVTVDRGSIAILSDSGDSFEIFALEGEKGASRVGDMVGSEGSALGTAVREERLVAINEPGDGDTSGITSFLVAPLTAGGRTFGTLNAGTEAPRRFEPQDRALLLQLASLVAATMESRRLFEEARVRADELAILNDMGRALTEQVDVRALTESVFRHTTRLLDAGSFCIVMKDPGRVELFVSEFGEDKELDEATLRIAEQLIDFRESLLIEEDIPARITELGIIYDGPVGESWLSVPMVTGDEVDGVIAVQSSARKRAYDEHDRDLLTAVAGQAAIAIENARLFEQVEERARRERILREVTASVRGTADVDSIMRKAAQELGRALGRQSFVYLGDGDEEEGAKSAEDS
jgi:GAF domain-containing protein